MFVLKADVFCEQQLVTFCCRRWKPKAKVASNETCIDVETCEYLSLVTDIRHWQMVDDLNHWYMSYIHLLLVCNIDNVLQVDESSHFST